jgi:hypothetical protein
VPPVCSVQSGGSFSLRVSTQAAATPKASNAATISSSINIRLSPSDLEPTMVSYRLQRLSAIQKQTQKVFICDRPRPRQLICLTVCADLWLEEHDLGGVAFNTAARSAMSIISPLQCALSPQRALSSQRTSLRAGYSATGRFRPMWSDRGTR